MRKPIAIKAWRPGSILGRPDHPPGFVPELNLAAVQLNSALLRPESAFSGPRTRATFATCAISAHVRRSAAWTFVRDALVRAGRLRTEELTLTGELVRLASFATH